MVVVLLLGPVLIFWIYFVYYVLNKLKNIEEKIRKPLKSQIERHAVELHQFKDLRNSRDIFLATLSHELRTPISGVTGAVQLLQGTTLNTQQREYTRMIGHANDILLEVVDDLLSYSRTQAGKIQLEQVPFSIRAILDDMLSLQTIHAQARGVALVRDIGPEVPSIVLGDRGKLNQILLNVIGNAIKFTDEGAVTVSVQCQSGSEENQVRLCFKVKDTGIGIAPHECKNIFTPFIQLGDTLENRRGGTGLGLAICQRLVHAMGGQIMMESVPEQGSCLTFMLDFDIAVDAPAPVHHSILLAASKESHSLTVLVVEDDEINRLVCTRYLALKGHHPLVAADSRQALLVMKNISYVPDAVLMDMNLPGITGIDLASTLRQQGGGLWKQVPVIIMSADASGSALERALLSGMAGFLAKPFTASQLSDTLLAATATGHLAEVQPAYRVQQRVQIMEQCRGLLDDAYLDDEIDVLGIDTMLELLNIFRASVATFIGEMTMNTGGLNWEAVAAGAHKLQGSAGNLGMVQVVALTRILQQNTASGGQMPEAQVMRWITELEYSCHRSCDALRFRLVGDGYQDITFVTDSKD